MLASAVFWTALRHVPSGVAPDAHWGTSVVKLKAALHAGTSLTMPSTAPSSASHLASIELDTSARSAGEKAWAMFGFTVENCWLSYSSSTAALGRLNPGSPAMMPSNWSAKRAAATMPDWPPLEPVSYTHLTL